MIQDHPTVLVVEDEHHLRDILMHALAKKHYDVISAEDGQQGLDHVHEADIVVLNLNLPKVSGEEFIKKLREKGNYIPIIIITAKMNRQEGMEKFSKYKIVDFMEKPFKASHVLKKIDEAMGISENIQFIEEAPDRLDEFIQRQNTEEIES